MGGVQGEFVGTGGRDERPAETQVVMKMSWPDDEPGKGRWIQLRNIEAQVEQACQASMGKLQAHQGISPEMYSPMSQVSAEERVAPGKNIVKYLFLERGGGTQA